MCSTRNTKEPQCRAEIPEIRDPYLPVPAWVEASGLATVRDNGENAPDWRWPEEIQLREDLTPVFTPSHYFGKAKRRHTVALGNFSDGRPSILFRIFDKHRDGSWHPTRYGATFSLPEFWTLCLKLNTILQERPELAENRPTRRGA